MQSSSRKALVIVLLTLPVFLVLAYFGMLSVAPEPSQREMGPVILDVSGQRYQHGDVVWLTEPGKPGDDAAVLYEWRKLQPAGMGPMFTIERFGDLSPEQQQHVFARICCKLGHNSAKGMEMKERVY